MNSDEEIKREDSTPSIIEQAKAQGWNAALYHFGRAEDPHIQYFNAGLIERSDGYWLIARRSEPDPLGYPFGMNSICAFLLDDTGKVPREGKRLRWLANEPNQQFEDARAIYDSRLNQTHMMACTFIWYGDSWSGAHQVFGSFDENWECKGMTYPRYGGNPGRMEKIPNHRHYEKNWLPWLHQGRLHLLYKSNPWIVVKFGETWEEREVYTYEEGASWKWGELRGGTPPVLAPGLNGELLYWTFPHSSLPWKSRFRRYYAGALAFETKPPFKPVLITPDPILAGSQNDPWGQRKPLVIFPCGALFKNGQWLISAGVNDLKNAWIEIPHESLVRLARPIEGNVTPIFSQTGLSKTEQLKIKLRENAARARAAKAAKRAQLAV